MRRSGVRAPSGPLESIRSSPETAGFFRLGDMYFTISTSRRPASDLGYLLHKNPARAQSFALAFGRAHVFYPEASEARCTAALLLDVDPVGLVRGRRGPAGEGRMLEQYVNDNPSGSNRRRRKASPPRQGTAESVAVSGSAASASSGPSLLRPASALPKTWAIATLRNDEATCPPGPARPARGVLRRPGRRADRESAAARPGARPDAERAPRAGLPRAGRASAVRRPVLLGAGNDEVGNVTSDRTRSRRIAPVRGDARRRG